MRKRLTLLCLSLLFCAALAGCQCEHQWTEATCTTPKTCSLCDETEGESLGHNWIPATCEAPETCSRCDEVRGTPINHTWIDATCVEAKKCSTCQKNEGQPLGHNEGDWEVVECDMVKATEVLKKYCTTCNEQLDRKARDMDSLHDTYRFLLTPNEFVERICNELQSLEGCNILAVSGATDEDFACALLNAETGDKTGLFLFVGDGASILESQEDDVCFDGAMGLINSNDDVAYVLLSLIQACDPSLSFSETKALASEILDDGEVTKNGISYVFTMTDDGVLFVFALED